MNKFKQTCKICNEPCNTSTCSHEHGMIYRYLKKFRLSQEQMLEICNVNAGVTLKAKYALWQRGITEHPLCEVCQAPLSNAKILSNTITSSTCSPACYTTKNTVIKQCDVCGTMSCNSNVCRAVTREFNKRELNVRERVNYLKNKYANLDEPVLFLDILDVNKLDGLPRCKYCGTEHHNIKRTGVSCCSLECGVAFARGKSYDEIVQNIKTEFPDCPDEFIASFPKHKMPITIKQCKCGVYYHNTCPNKCGNRQHYLNLDQYNLEGFQQFIEDDLFDLKGAMSFFGASEPVIRRKKSALGITNSCKFRTEDTIGEFISACCNIVKNDRTLIRPKEVDVKCDTHKFCVEYDGQFWHSEGQDNIKRWDKGELKKFHVTKTEMCERQGHQLFHVFSSEWLNKREIWESVINSKLGRTERVHARKCQIRELTSKECSSFVQHNHLQGNKSASVRLGLYYNNELVSVMTFGKSRYDKSIQYELIRFCSKLNTTVVGGASKLLSYFVKSYHPTSIISYANRRWSTGNLYEKLGFAFVKNTAPGYFYFRGDDTAELMSREKFQKHKLKDKLESFDPSLTETQNMYNNGYRKIFDSGNKVYVWRSNEPK